MKRAPLKFAALVSVLCATSASALGDVAPPGGRKGGTCNPADQSKDGLECLGCRAYFKNRDHCEYALGVYGFTQSCRTPGASTWREVWCRKKDPSAKVVPPNVLASLDDASAGESGGDSGSADAASAPAQVPSAEDAGAAAPASSTAPVDPKRQSSGCGTCAVGSASAKGSDALALALIPLLSAVVVGRRLTRYRRAHSARS
jgi:hypothetical protein